MLLGAAVPVLAVSDAAPDDSEHNRRLLDRYRADPDHYARLLRDLRAFQALPPDRQERMRQFDRDLHDQDADTQDRLWVVLERYTDWVNRLPEADQKRIEQAADRNERLAIVKQLRMNDWMERLPKKDRDDLAGAAAGAASGATGRAATKGPAAAPGVGGLGQGAEGASQPAAGSSRRSAGGAEQDAERVFQNRVDQGGSSRPSSGGRRPDGEA